MGTYSPTWQSARTASRYYNGNSGFEIFTNTLADHFETVEETFYRGAHEFKGASGGFFAVFKEAGKIVEDELQNSSVTTKFVSGTALGLAGLFGSIPFAITDLLSNASKRFAKGPSAVGAFIISELVNKSTSSIINIFDSAKALFSSDAQVFEKGIVFGESLGTFLLIFSGAKAGFRFSKNVGQFSLGLPEISGNALTANALCISNAGISGSLALGGGLAGAFLSKQGTEQTSTSETKPRGKQNHGFKQRLSDQEIYDELKRCGFNQSKASANLKISQQAISLRISKAPIGSPLNTLKGKSVIGSVSKHSREQIQNAVVANGYNQTAAATEIGMTRGALKSRLSKDPTLKPLREKARPGTKPLHTPDTRLAIYEKNGFNQSQTARELGMSREGFKGWLKRYQTRQNTVPETAPDLTPKVQTAKPVQTVEKVTTAPKPQTPKTTPVAKKPKQKMRRPNNRDALKPMTPEEILAEIKALGIKI